MLEVCKVILKPNIIAENLFILLLKTLNNIVYNNCNARLSLLKFLCEVLSGIGYKLNFTTCDNCNMKFVGDIKFDMGSGTFRCASCSGGTIISKQEFVSLKIIDECNIEKIKTIKISNDTLNNLLRLMIGNLSFRLNHKFKSIDIKEI
jgi:DNA repair protein RecO